MAIVSGKAMGVRVLHSVAAPDTSTRFINQLAVGAPTELRLLYFSWDLAMEAEYDVFHVHWPEYLMRGHSIPGRLRQRYRFIRLMARLRRRRIPIVRTVHNLEPHERSSWVERRLLRFLDRQTAMFVRLNPATVISSGGESRVILHGHYRDRFRDYDHLTPQAGLMLNFGLIRPYKGIDTLLELFQAWPNQSAALRIVGKPLDSALAHQIQAATEADNRVSAELRFVNDEELVREVTHAQLVILPYREMHNSGTLLVALSLNRPVIVPHSSSNQAISDEVGPGWIFQYDGELTAEFVETVLATVQKGPRPDAPDLSGRDWTHIGAEHLDMYLDLVGRT
jgi:beta-1,4-mannosyltransferase